MRKFITISLLLTGLFNLLLRPVQAQVTGVGYTFSPTGEYVFWDDQAGISDGLLIGGKVGFSFGEYLELRGMYMQGQELTTDFSTFGIENVESDELVFGRDIDFKRYGGEIKVNLGRGALLPYLTLGTGIQEIGLDSIDMENRKQIYVNTGVGISLSAADRFTLNIEAKNTQYNYNPVGNLLTDEDRSIAGLEPADFMSDRLSNWSVSAALQFYLGGRRPGELSELDRAYMKRFSSGFRGGSVPVEITLGRMNFSEDLPYRDTWMAGAHAGVDFGPYVGLRAFYMQALEGGTINVNTDPLAMYGGELRLKLNSGTGLTPFAIIGGGYLNVNEEEYVGRDSLSNGAAAVEDQAFVLGGIGVNLPLSKNFKLFGAARAHLMASNDEVEDLESTDDIQTSWLYSFGAKLDFGRKAKTAQIVEDRVTEKIVEQQEENDERMQQLKQKYQQRLVDIRTELNDAYNKADLDKAAALLQEEDTAKRVLEELEKREEARIVEKKEAQEREVRNIQQEIAASPDYERYLSGSRIQMSPAELENLIDEILDGMGTRGQNISGTVGDQMNAQRMQEMMERRDLEAKIDALQQTMLQIGERQAAAKDLSKAEQELQNETLRRDLTEFSARLMNEIRRLEAKMEGKEGNAVAPATTTTIVEEDGTTVITTTDDNTLVIDEEIVEVQPTAKYLATPADSSLAAKLRYEGMAGFTGFNLGGQTTFNVGFRWHYGIGNTALEFMPEAFFGFGSPSSFGLTANIVLPVELKKSPIMPYIGLGAGFMQIEEVESESGVRLNYNVILGTYLDVWKGRLFVDLTARNAFKYNQVIAGYRFAF